MKVLLSFSLVVMMTAKVFSQDPTPANCQFASVVTVDGQGDEWPLTWLEDSDKKFKYNICTDDNNIYIRMMAKDEVVRRKIALFGLTVWMDPNGKKKKRLGLHFPTGTESKEKMDQMEKTGEDRFTPNMTSQQRREFQNNINRRMIEDLEVLELLGLADDPITSTRTGINNGLKVAIGSDSTGAYVYEAIIPFKAYRLSKANIEELNIGFETGKFIPPPPKAGSGNVAQGGPGQGGYGGGGMGGRMGGGGMGGGRGNYGGARTPSAGPMATSSSIWVPVKLK